MHFLCFTCSQCVCYLVIVVDVDQCVRKLANDTSLGFDDVNQGLHTFQSIVVVPHPAIGVRACPNAWEIALVVLASCITAVDGVPHDRKYASELYILP